MDGSAALAIRPAQPGIGHNGGPALDVTRPVPCICPRQHEKAAPIGLTVAITRSRGLDVERIRCSDCERTWTRISA